MLFDIKSSDLLSGSNKQKSGYCVRIRRNKNEPGIEFLIGNVLPRKAEEDIRSPKQFELLTKFLDWKGEEFQNKLYDAYQVAYDELMELGNVMAENHDKDQPLQYAIVHKVLDLFNVDEIKDYLVNVYKLKAPNVLKDDFDMQIQKDEEGTREQTYTKPDYIDLAAMVVIIKGTFMVIGQYAYLLEDKYDQIELIGILYKFYSRHAGFMKTPGMIKLMEFVEKLLHNPKVTQEEVWRRILEKQISDNEILEYILGQVIFHKLNVSSIINDNDETYAVNMMFKFVTNKLKSQGNTSSNIRNKTCISGSDEGMIEKESFFESFRSGSDMTTGDVVKSNWAVSSFDLILSQLSDGQREIMTRGIEIPGGKKYSYLDIHKSLSRTGLYAYSDQSIILIQTVFRGMMDERLIFRIEGEGMMNLLSLAVVYVWNLGFPKLATLISSVPVTDMDGKKVISLSSGRSRIPPEIIEQLYKIYPLYRQTTGKKDSDVEYVIRKNIEVYTASFYSESWLPYLPEELVASAYGMNQDRIPVPEDLKIQFSKFLIANEQLVYRNKNK